MVDTRPRTVSTLVAGVPAARSHAAFVREADGSVTEIRETCADLSAGFGAASNPRTVIWRDPPSADSRVRSVLTPDGVLRGFSYASGAWSGSLASPGVAAFQEGAAGGAMRVTVTTGTEASPGGVPGKTLRTVTYSDGAGDGVLEEVWACCETGFVRVAWAASAFDAWHNPTGRVDSAGSASTSAWAGKRLPLAAADASGAARSYLYDALGRVSAEVRPAAGGAPALTNSFAYDAEGRVTETAVSSGGLSRRLSAASYDRAGRAVSATDENGRTVSYAYADGGRTVTETLPGGGAVVRAFWPGGAPRSVTGSAAEPPVWYAYGLSEGLSWIRASAGSADSPSQVTRYADPAGRTVSVRYADGLSEALAYDLAGRLTNSLDRAGRATRLAWDAAGNPLSVSRQADAGFATVSSGLDLPALAESLTNEAGALIRRTVRDIPGRTLTDTDIAGLDEVIRYDAAGRAASVLRRDGVLVSNVWDAAGLLAEVRHGDVPVLGLAYRADGLPLAASNASASVSWQYDGLGRPTSETARNGAGAIQASVAYAYDASALATNTALSVESWTLSVERSFDSAGRLHSLSGSGGTFQITYGGTNGLPVRVSNSALTAESAYDILNRMTNTVYRNAAGAAVGSFAYAYDSLGLVTQKIGVLGGAAVTNAYAYDALGRLTVEVSSQQSEVSVTTNTYDLAGNRLSRSGTGVPAADYAYTNNRLVSVGSSAVLYDAAGNVTNMVSRGGVTLALSWNTCGQLVSVATNGVFAESYAYDPLGRRAATTTGGATVFHAYDGDQCAADLDASGDPLRSYTWGVGIDDLLAVTVYGDATNTYYAVKDHLGSVHALVDSTGAVVETYSYDAWGNASILTSDLRPLTSSQFGNRYLFQGREYSEATGLYNFRARWYAPEIGRWLSPDPIGLEGGLNLYEFCGNDPVNFRDPSGLICDREWVEEWLKKEVEALEDYNPEDFLFKDPFTQFYEFTKHVHNIYYDKEFDRDYNDESGQRKLLRYEYRDHGIVLPCRITNIGIGYSSYKAYGLLGSGAICVVGELWSWKSFAAARGSFRDNAIGAWDAFRDLHPWVPQIPESATVPYGSPIPFGSPGGLPLPEGGGGGDASPSVCKN